MIAHTHLLMPFRRSNSTMNTNSVNHVWYLSESQIAQMDKVIDWSIAQRTLELALRNDNNSGEPILVRISDVYRWSHHLRGLWSLYLDKRNLTMLANPNENLANLFFHTNAIVTNSVTLAATNSGMIIMQAAAYSQLAEMKHWENSSNREFSCINMRAICQLASA